MYLMEDLQTSHIPVTTMIILQPQSRINRIRRRFCSVFHWNTYKRGIFWHPFYIYFYYQKMGSEMWKGVGILLPVSAAIEE